MDFLTDRRRSQSGEPARRSFSEGGCPNCLIQPDGECSLCGAGELASVRVRALTREEEVER